MSKHRMEDSLGVVEDVKTMLGRIYAGLLPQQAAVGDSAQAPMPAQIPTIAWTSGWDGDTAPTY